MVASTASTSKKKRYGLLVDDGAPFGAIYKTEFSPHLHISPQDLIRLDYIPPGLCKY